MNSCRIANIYQQTLTLLVKPRPSCASIESWRTWNWQWKISSFHAKIRFSSSIFSAVSFRNPTYLAWTSENSWCVSHIWWPKPPLWNIVRPQLEIVQVDYHYSLNLCKISYARSQPEAAILKATYTLGTLPKNDCWNLKCICIPYCKTLSFWNLAQNSEEYIILPSWFITRRATNLRTLPTRTYSLWINIYTHRFNRPRPGLFISRIRK